MPRRIQRKRTKGWRLPENAVCVTRPGDKGNPFPIGVHDEKHGFVDTAEKSVKLFRIYALRRLKKEPGWLEPLRGKDLACWCKEDAEWCHADVLLELANKPTSQEAPCANGAEDA